MAQATPSTSGAKERSVDATSSPERPRDLSQLRRLFTYTRPYRTPLIIGIVAVMVASVLGFAFPLMARELFDTAFAGGPNERGWSLNTITLALVGIFVVQAVFNYFRVYYLALVGEGVVADLRRTLYDHLIGLSVRFFEERKTGEITSRLTSDIATVQSVVSQALAQFVNQLITLLGGVAILFYLDFKLTLVMLSVVPAVVLAGAYFGRKLRRISTEFQDQVASANASAEEAITGIRVVKSFTAEEVERRRYGTLIGNSYRVALRRARVRAAFIPSIIFATFSAIAVVFWYGGRLVLNNQLPAGDLIAFLLLTLFVAGSIATFPTLYSQFQEALGASKRIFDLLDEQSDLSEPVKPKTLGRVQGSVAFEEVSFRYGDAETGDAETGDQLTAEPRKGRGDALVLRNLSLSANPGEVVALVGPSGAGKSTLITLIPRFYDPTAGRVTLDGVDLRELDTHDLRTHIGIVPQETQLFSGTVAENIRYGKPEATDEELEDAAKAANAHDFIEEFPNGYKTIVGERGVKLSGGQRQRVAIARALLKNPKILILDEATSSLDSESEALVQAALDTLMQGRTVFVIAHRLSTIRNADRILVLERGRIVQSGTHSSLMAQGGLYHDLYEKQFRQEEVTSYA